MDILRKAFKIWGSVKKKMQYLLLLPQNGSNFTSRTLARNLPLKNMNQDGQMTFEFMREAGKGSYSELFGTQKSTVVTTLREDMLMNASLVQLYLQAQQVLP